MINEDYHVRAPGTGSSMTRASISMEQTKLSAKEEQ